MSSVRNRQRATLLHYVDGDERDPVTNRPARTVVESTLSITSLQPLPTSETTADGGSQDERWNVFVWTDIAIVGEDRIRVDGVVFELAGDATRFDVGGCFHHQEAVIARSR